MSFLIENSIGRFVEIRVDGSLNEDEAQQLRTRMYLVLGAVKGRAVLYGDLEGCEPFSASVGEKMGTMIKIDNAKVERSIFLVRSGPLARQIERFIGDAARAAEQVGKQPPERRVFYEKRAACAWLNEVLAPAERKRLGQFAQNR